MVRAAAVHSTIGLTPPTSAPGLGSPHPHLHLGLGSALPHLQSEGAAIHRAIFEMLCGFANADWRGLFVFFRAFTSVRRLKCLIEHFEWPSRALKLADPKVLWATLHICAGTGLTPATSAPGLGSRLPHLHRD